MILKVITESRASEGLGDEDHFVYPLKCDLNSAMQCDMTAEQAFEPFAGIAPYPFDDFNDSVHPDSRPLTLVRSNRKPASLLSYRDHPSAPT